jgi:hypothetical protein
MDEPRVGLKAVLRAGLRAGLTAAWTVEMSAEEEGATRVEKWVVALVDVMDEPRVGLKADQTCSEGA